MLRHLILNECAGLGWCRVAAAVCGAGAKGCEPGTVGNARGLASRAGPWVGTEGILEGWELTGVALLCHGAMCPGIVVGGADLGTEIGRTLKRRLCLSAGDSMGGVGIAGVQAQ